MGVKFRKNTQIGIPMKTHLLQFVVSKVGNEKV